MNRLLWAALILVLGCDTTRRERDPISQNMTMDGGTVPTPDQGTMVDAGAGDMASDGRVADARPEPDAAPEPRETPEVECDGLDSDDDGRIDEGVANACGGCGGIPPGGCQHWRVNLVQNGEDPLNPRRLVGMTAGILGVSFTEIPNGTCRIMRLQRRFTPDDHMGDVDIDRSGQVLRLSPTFDPEGLTNGYEPAQEELPWTTFSAGDTVSVTASGGRAIGAFDTRLTVPDKLDLLPATGLDDFVAAIRGDEAMDEIGLNWTPTEAENSTLKLYIGGSRIAFRRVRFYQAIEHYVLDGDLRDDGSFVLPDSFRGAGVAQSSIWVYLARLSSKRLVFGPHAVSLSLGQRVDVRASGGVGDAEMPPFQITSPSPNTREFTPGDPLPVRWSDLPEGTGPLVISLNHRDDETQVQTLIDCEVVDPSLGEATLPAEITADVPDGEGQFRQLTLKWTMAVTRLPSPDRGTLTKAVSVILDFTR